MHSTDRRVAGMTLIETLIVITILGILAALLFPVLSAAREKARAAGCQSHLRQLGGAFRIYVDDYDGVYPGAAPFNPVDFNLGWGRAGQWVYVPDTPPDNLPINPSQGALFPYVKDERLYLCPSAYYSKPKRLSYSMGSNLTFLHEAQLGDMSGLVLLVDENEALNDGWFAPGCPHNAPGVDVPTAVHNAGANFLFCDGHVKWARPGDALVDSCKRPGPFYP